MTIFQGSKYESVTVEDAKSSHRRQGVLTRPLHRRVGVTRVIAPAQSRNILIGRTPTAKSRKTTIGRVAAAGNKITPRGQSTVVAG